MNKMLSREACVERYGAIDLASLHWQDSHKWIQMFEVPKGVFPNWKVMQTEIPVTHIAINLDLHRPLGLALTAIVNQNLQAELKTFDGAFNIRLARGGKELSAHSWGLALDINAETNKLGTPGDMTGELALCFEQFGFRWGKRFHRQDPQHFSYCWEG